jgi:hypothetical protein
MTPSKIPPGSTSAPNLSGLAISKNPKLTTRLPSVELGIGVAFFLFLLGLRWFYVGTQPWDSDEPQHLHVVWAWANGLLPYKDVFDNHAPLFQAMSAPLFAWLGERADIVIAMRWAMVPIAALILLTTYFICARLFSPRVGFWGTLLVAAFPDFYFKLGECRPDGFWAATWLVILAILTGGKPHPRRLFAAGFVFGVAFAVSMKTTFLLLTVLVAAIVVWLLQAAVPRPTGYSERTGYQVISCFLAPVAGALIVPLVVIVFFASKGALHQMYYCVITHNIIAESDPQKLFFQRSRDIRFWLFVPMIAGGLWLARRDNDRDRAIGRLFFLSVTGLFCPLLFTFWPLVSKQDFIPFFPMLLLAVACPLVALAEWIRSRIGLPSFVLPALVASGELVWMVSGHPPLKQNNQRNLEVISDTLNLTHPGETVFDAKGQTIFRPRPYYYVFEQITRERVERGELRDDAPERLVAARTPVAVQTYWLTRATEQFIDQNYVSTGSILVLGKKIALPKDRHVQFEIMIPEKYMIVSNNGPVSGTLDGTELNGPRELSSGVHNLTLNSREDTVAVVWSRAIEKGYSPFELVTKQK